MSWRIVHIGNPAKLSVTRGQLVVEQDELRSVPLEDIHTLIVDSHGVATSTRALAEMSDNGVTCIVCDDKHLPTGVLLPLQRHSRTRLVAERQLALTIPLKKRLWQRMIISKIENQARVLGFIGSRAADLEMIAKSVQSGDTTNREAYAARLYFQEMLQGRSRGDDDIFNSLINYGYAIVRGVIARELAAHGFLPAFGIHHSNDLNNFNLADDFLEPFRPTVDMYAWRWLRTREGLGDDLLPQDKMHMINVLNEKVRISEEVHALRYAVELCVKSFSTVCDSGKYEALLVPNIV